ncbi:hypothetical protein ACIQNU_18470 [Streptomyces sp. NPDC091292]|uniref:hypothetical protein n=1 Tax=Streptomyces sp. NPDC091292 TaxID=3365991 RepID=UPI0037F1814B
MTAGSGFRGRRSPVARRAALLALLLVGLMHLLACAHGAAAADTSRVDCLWTATTSCAQPDDGAQDPARQDTAPEPGDPSGCWDADEPTAQPPRGLALAVDAVQSGTAVDHSPVAPRPAPRAGPPPTHGGLMAGDAGQVRARLGIWRT